MKAAIDALSRPRSAVQAMMEKYVDSPESTKLLLEAMDDLLLRNQFRPKQPSDLELREKSSEILKAVNDLNSLLSCYRPVDEDYILVCGSNIVKGLWRRFPSSIKKSNNLNDIKKWNTTVGDVTEFALQLEMIGKGARRVIEDLSIKGRPADTEKDLFFLELALLFRMFASVRPTSSKEGVFEAPRTEFGWFVRHVVLQTLQPERYRRNFHRRLQKAIDLSANQRGL